MSAGEYLCHQNDPADCLYFIVAGKVSAYLETDVTIPIRVFSSYSTTILGEIGFYLDTPRTASIIAEEESVIYILTHTSLIKIQQELPEMAIAFHQGVVRLLAERLSRTNKEIELLNKVWNIKLFSLRLAAGTLTLGDCQGGEAPALPLDFHTGIHSPCEVKTI